MPPQIPPRAVDSQTADQPSPSPTSSLWSSSYASGTGAKIAAAIDVGLVLVLVVFIGVVILQWKKRTGSLEVEEKDPGTNRRDKTPVTGSDRDVEEAVLPGAGNECTSTSSTTGKADVEKKENPCGHAVDLSRREVV